MSGSLEECIRESQQTIVSSAEIPETTDTPDEPSGLGSSNTLDSLARNVPVRESTADRRIHRTIPRMDEELIASSKGLKVEHMLSSTGAVYPELSPAAWNDKIVEFLGVVEQSRAGLLRQALNFTNCRDEAEDMVQEAFLRAYRNLPYFRGRAKMSTWLHVIVKNIGREWLRNRKGRSDLPLECARNRDDEPIVLDFPDPGRDPEQCCGDREMTSILRSEIGELNPVCRHAIMMCALEELSYREVAKTLGTNVCTIKSRVNRGKQMLKRAVCLRIIRRKSLSRPTEPAL